MYFKKRTIRIFAASTCAVVILCIFFSNFISGGSTTSGKTSIMSNNAIQARTDKMMDSSNGFTQSDTSNLTTQQTSAAPEKLTKIEAGRKVIMSGSIEIETKNFDLAIKSLKQTIATSGGFIQDSSISGNRIYPEGEQAERTAMLSARVPREKFDSVMDSIGSIGSIINKSTKSEDVTTQFYDNEARLKTLKVKQERLLDLMRRTRNFSDIIPLENELQSNEYEIETITTTQRKLSTLVEYSTIEISLHEVYVETKPVAHAITLTEKIKKSFVDSVETILGLAKALLIVLAALIPFALIGAVLFVILWFAVIKKRRMKSKTITENQVQKAE